MASASSPNRLPRLLDEIAADPSMNEGVIAMQERGRFDDATAKMVGIALDERARQVLDDTLDEFWTHDAECGVGMGSAGHDEVIIGGGYHAAVYASARTMLGFPKPLVIEQRPRAGGMFAISKRPSFYLNSRNRPGQLLTPGERGALNVIPGSPIQPSMLSNLEFQRNTDMAFIVRMALAMSAKVCVNTAVSEVTQSVSGSRRRYRVILADGRSVLASRVIWATGMGLPRSVSADTPAPDRLLTFEQFMARMDERFPLRGLRRVAVLGGGDSGKCAIEALFGMGPSQHWSIPDLDMPEFVDWYGNVESSCANFLANTRNRYKRIGSLLPKSSADPVKAPIRPVQMNVGVEPGFECCVVNGKRYDLVINCTGFFQANPSLCGVSDYFSNYKYSSSAQKVILGFTCPDYKDVFTVGPAKGIPFSDDEVNAGYNSTAENAVAMWRLGGRTATLAERVGPVAA